MVTASPRAPRRAQHPAGQAGPVRAETVRRLERNMGALGTAAMASMEQRLPWFRALPAENRSWIGLVAQAGIAAFVDWVKHPQRRPAVAGEVFGTAPRELARAVSLQQTVEMVRITIDVVEAQVDELAAPGGEAELREAVLRYTREIAFGTAQVYARTAEARGAWDARLDLLADVHGHRLVIVLGGAADPVQAAAQFAGRFGAGPIVVGPTVGSLESATLSASAALAGLRAAAAWPEAPRPVEA